MSWNVLRTFLIGLLIVLPLLSGGQGGETFTEDPSGEARIQLSRSQIPDFLEVYTGMVSDVQFYDVQASGITSDLVISVEKPFGVSLNCYEDFVQSITLSRDGSNVNQTRVFVRFFPENTGNKSATISHSAGPADPKQLSLKGRGTAPAIPEGYYSNATSNGSRLKTELYHIIDNHRTQTYSSLWTHFTTTDATFDGKVWDMYSNTPCDDPPYIYTFGTDQDTGAGGNQEGDVYNREHSMPRSWFGGSVNPMHTDLYHIFPVDKWVNAVRANYPFGEVNNPTWTSMNGGKLGNNSLEGYAGIAFEPIDDYKGDLARAFFYMITRYENQIPFWDFSPEGNNMLSQETYPGYHPWVIDMLRRWHENDPVSQKEIRRNNRVYDIQGNRNPFIDHPEFVERIWGDTTLNLAPGADPQFILRVFPNPAAHHLTIETGWPMESVRLVCLKGSTILTRNTYSKEMNLNLPPLPPGMYIVIIKSETGIARQTLQVLQ